MVATKDSSERCDERVRNASDMDRLLPRVAPSGRSHLARTSDPAHVSPARGIGAGVRCDEAPATRHERGWPGPEDRLQPTMKAPHAVRDGRSSSTQFASLVDWK